MIFALSLQIFILVGIYSVVFSKRRLNRPGVSKQVRKLFTRKHTNYVIAFIILWTTQLIANYYHLFNPH